MLIFDPTALVMCGRCEAGATCTRGQIFVQAEFWRGSDVICADQQQSASNQYADKAAAIVIGLEDHTSCLPNVKVTRKMHA
jgi:hypothetical protein